MQRAELVSFFALQPRGDIKDASKSLFLAANQASVQIIREIFPAKPAKSKKDEDDNSHTALLLLVRVFMEFHVRHEKLLTAILQEARKEFLRRTVTRSQLEACIGNLIQMINEVNPRIVVAFGKVAWNSTLLIDSHDSPFTKVPTSTRWNNRILISTHHPSSLKKKGDKETVFQGIVTLINP